MLIWNSMAQLSDEFGLACTALNGRQRHLRFELSGMGSNQLLSLWKWTNDLETLQINYTYFEVTWINLVTHLLEKPTIAF